MTPGRWHSPQRNECHQGPSGPGLPDWTAPLADRARFRHEQKRFSARSGRDGLCVRRSPDGAKDRCHPPDALVYSAILDPGAARVHELSPGGKACYTWCREGLPGRSGLTTGDGAWSHGRASGLAHSAGPRPRFCFSMSAWNCRGLPRNDVSTYPRPVVDTRFS